MVEVTFSQSILLLPVATLLHVLEEWPGFPRWARRFASPRYTDRDYLSVHAVALAVNLVAAVAVFRFPKPPLLFLLFTFLLGPAMFWNAFFHLGATVVSRRYCPGVVTGLVVYMPLSFSLAGLALREGLLPPSLLVVAAAVALVVHALEVGHNVYKIRWRDPRTFRVGGDDRRTVCESGHGRPT